MGKWEGDVMWGRVCHNELYTYTRLKHSGKLQVHGGLRRRRGGGGVGGGGYTTAVHGVRVRLHAWVGRWASLARSITRGEGDACVVHM